MANSIFLTAALKKCSLAVGVFLLLLLTAGSSWADNLTLSFSYDGGLNGPSFYGVLTGTYLGDVDGTFIVTGVEEVALFGGKDRHDFIWLDSYEVPPIPTFVTVDGTHMDLVACTTNGCDGPGNEGFDFFSPGFDGGLGYVDECISSTPGGGCNVSSGEFEPSDWHATIAPEPSAVILLLTVLLAVAYVARKRYAQGLAVRPPE